MAHQSFPRSDAPSRPQRLRILTRASVVDLLKGLQVDESSRFRTLAKVAGRVPARSFARVLVRYDDLVAREGMVAGAELLLRSFTRTLTVDGADSVPAYGPVLITANHPGLVDAMALVAALRARPDLRIIAADRDLLRAIPAVGERLLYVHPDRGGRTGLLREVVAHLQAGGAVLTFPAGHIEPDPAIDLDAALRSLDDWTDSAALFLRRVPETVVVAAVVSGVLSVRARGHRWSRRLSGKGRDSAAATLQVLWPPYRDTRTSVRFGRPREATMAGIREATAALLEP